MKLTRTSRGFALHEFKDANGEKCSLQKSSAAENDFIWLGIDDARPLIMASKTKAGGTGWVPYDIPSDVLLTTRMHLSREQVAALIPVLQRFADYGDTDQDGEIEELTKCEGCGGKIPGRTYWDGEGMELCKACFYAIPEGQKS